MQYKNSIEAIYFQLNELVQNVAEWGTERELRTIDIDLTLDKIRDVYDIISSLKNEQLQQPSAKIIEEEVIEKETPIEDLSAKEEVVEEKAAPIQENSAEAIYDMEEEKSVPEPPIQAEIKEEIKEKIKASVVKPKNPLTTSISDKFNHDRPTLHEELSTHVESEDLANHLKNRPITNLSSAIGLNEKFEFIHNLFNGDKEKYEETIEKLNVASNFNEAFNYLSVKLGWNMSEPMPQRILELIRRKLIVNQ